MHKTYPFLFTAFLTVLVAGVLPGCASTESSAQDMSAESDMSGERGMMADKGFVEVNGARIHYRAEGEGTPMLLVHGYPLTGDLFREQRAALSGDYRVITPTLRGYGQSEAPGDEPQAGIETYAEDMLAFMDEMEIEEAVIGGMSMGGPVVLSMYEQAPDRFLGMVLFDTIAAAANPIEAGTWRGTVEFLRGNSVSALPPLLIDEMLTGEARRDRKNLARAVKSMMKQASLQAAVAGAQALAGRPDLQPMLGRIDVPVLILVGLQDTIYPPKIARRMGRMIPDAEVVVIDDASHAAAIEEGERVNDAIRDWAAGMR